MTTPTNILALPCLTDGEPFRPDINTACLLLDRDLYHTARRALFGPANEFLVSKLASWTIPTLTASYGALASCLRERCLASGFSPLISLMTFQLGDAEDPALAKVRIDAFINVLGMCGRRKLRVERLTIQLANYSFRSDARLGDFCVVLAKGCDVGKSLVVEGLDVHLELCTRALPAFTRMVVEPVKWHVNFRTDDWRQLGSFRAEYVKDSKAVEQEEAYGPELRSVYVLLRHARFLKELAKMEGKRDPLKVGNGIVDPHTEYWVWLETAPQDWITNGLDYVTEHTLEI